MPNFMLAYHGGNMPETPEEGAAEMERWNNWFAAMGEAVVDGGNPVGKSTTVSASGVTDNGGKNPLSGYSILKADNIEGAIELAKGCPIIGSGSVEVAEIVEM